jgi:hypothetical protein
LITEDIPVATGTISLTISRGVAEGVHEDLDLVNYNRNPIKFNLEIPGNGDTHNTQWHGGDLFVSIPSNLATSLCFWHL